MKKLMMIILAATVAGAVNAQEVKTQATRGQKAPERTEHMVKELGLTPEQATKVGVINADLDKAIGKMREENAAARNAGERPVAGDQAREIKTKYEAELKEVLTADQWTKWEEIQQAGKQKRMEVRQERKANPQTAPSE